MMSINQYQNTVYPLYSGEYIIYIQSIHHTCNGANIKGHQ